MSDEIRQMNELINDARELMGNMKAQYEINKAQFEQQCSLLDKKISMLEKSWGTFRSIAIVLFTVIIVPLFVGGVSIKGDVNSLTNHVEKEDNVQVQEFYNSVDVMTEHNADMFESAGVPKEEVEKTTDRIKTGISRVMGDVSRSPIEE